MGGGQSRQIQYIVNEEPYPGTAGASNLSLSQAEKCNACQLGVNTKITTSNVKLKREVGAISTAECKRFADDWNRVTNKTLSTSDFLAKLQNGRYSRLVSDNGAGDQYCQELSIPDEDAVAMREGGTLDAGKFKTGRIRKVSGSSFSEETKAKIIPSIPFEMFFAAKKAAFDSKGKVVYRSVSESFPVTQMTLYHPSPIRIDSVQADALLSLNDPTDKGAKYIVLIPLRSANSGAPSVSFFSKIASQLLTIKEPRPDTGEYQETTIPTGADWALDKLFTLTGEAGSSTVKNGFFTWTGVSGYERVNKGTVQGGQWFAPTATTTIGWKQAEGLSAPQYILLDTPLDINPEDMASLTQSLPATPPSEAVHTIPPQINMVYYKASEPPAPDSISGKSSCAFPNLCEGFTTGTLDQSVLSTCPGAKCDPFLQNAMLSQNQDSIFTAQGMFSLFFNFLLFIAMLVGAYIALRMVSEDYDLSVRNFAEKMGRVAAVWAKGVSNKIRAVGSLSSMLRGSPMDVLKGKAEGSLGGLADQAKGMLESKGDDLAGSLKGALESKGGDLAGKFEGALGSKGEDLAGSLKGAFKDNGKDGLGTALSSLLSKKSA